MNGGGSGGSGVDRCRDAACRPRAARRRRPRDCLRSTGGVQERPDATRAGTRRSHRTRPAGRCGGGTPVCDARERRGSRSSGRLPAGGAARSAEWVAHRRPWRSSTCGRELASGNRGLLSRRLSEALAGLDTTAGEQAMRSSIGGGPRRSCCAETAAMFRCERPSTPLRPGSRCAAIIAAARRRSRPAARTAARPASHMGGGTERVERESERLSRSARGASRPGHRGAAGRHRPRSIDTFSGGGLDVLVGTDLVAKGLDVPNVTWSASCHRTWRSTSRTSARPSGRTSSHRPWAAPRRGDRPGRAILQTYQPDHAALQAVATGDAARFPPASSPCASSSARRRSGAS